MADIFISARYNDVESMENLLRSGVDPNERDGYGRTALHICATYGSESTTSILLTNGANHTIQDYESGWTALHRSLYFRHLGVTLLLIKAGAKLGDEMSNTFSECRADVTPKRESTRCIRDNDKWKSPIDHDGYSPLDLLSLHLSPHLSKAKSIMKCTEILVFGKADYPLGIPLPNSSDVIHPKRIEPLASCRVVDVSASKFHSIAVTYDGELYSWGHGRSGRLGHGDETTQPAPQLIIGLLGRKIKAVALAENHSICCCYDGNVYTWGSNRFGQLGHGHKENITILTSPKRIENMKKLFVLGVAAGTHHSVCFTNEGDIYTWGSNKNGQLGLKHTDLETMDGGGIGTYTPHKVQLILHKFSNNDNNISVGNRRRTLSDGSKNIRDVIQVCASAFSTLVLFHPRNNENIFTSVNEVYQWGHGSSSPSKVYFSEIKNKRSYSKGNVTELFGFENYHLRTNINITHISAGRCHNVAVSSAGHVYTWGLGSDQLGHGSKENQLSSPHIVEALLPENGGGRGVYVSAASYHSCLVTDTGDIYTWGASEEKGVLGHGQGKYQPVPKRVVGIKRAVKVAAGDDHTLTLTAYSVPNLPHDHIDDNNSINIPKLETGIITENTLIGVNANVEQTTHANTNLDDSILSEEIDNHENNNICLNSLPANIHTILLDEDNVPTLKAICERKLASLVDLRSVINLLDYAETFQAPALETFCSTFIQSNLDAVLVQRLRQLNGRSYTDKLLSRLQPIDNMMVIKPGLEGYQKFNFNNSNDLIIKYDDRRERSSSQDYDSIEGLNKIIRGIKKKLKDIDVLKTKMDNNEQLSSEQIEKIERKFKLENELQRVIPMLLKLESKKKLRENLKLNNETSVQSLITSNLESSSKDMNILTVSNNATIEESLNISNTNNDLSKLPSLNDWMTSSTIIASTNLISKDNFNNNMSNSIKSNKKLNVNTVSRTIPPQENLNLNETKHINVTTITPPSCSEWLSSSIVTSPGILSTTSTNITETNNNTKNKKIRDKNNFIPLDTFVKKSAPIIHDSGGITNNNASKILGPETIATKRSAWTTQESVINISNKSTGTTISAKAVENTPMQPKSADFTCIMKTVVTPSKSIQFTPVKCKSTEVTPAKCKSAEVTPMKLLAAPSKSSEVALLKTKSMEVSPLPVKVKGDNTAKSSPQEKSPNYLHTSRNENNSLLDFVKPILPSTSNSTTPSSDIQKKASPNCPWKTPSKTTPNTAYDTTTPDNKSNISSLYEIQLEEENLRKNSNMSSLSGHDNPWYIERRVRTESFENVIRIQKEEQMIAMLKIQEENELQVALAAIDALNKKDEEMKKKRNKKSNNKGLGKNNKIQHNDTNNNNK